MKPKTPGTVIDPKEYQYGYQPYKTASTFRAKKAKLTKMELGLKEKPRRRNLEMGAIVKQSKNDEKKSKFAKNEAKNDDSGSSEKSKKSKKSTKTEKIKPEKQPVKIPTIRSPRYQKHIKTSLGTRQKPKITPQKPQKAKNSEKKVTKNAFYEKESK